MKLTIKQYANCERDYQQYDKMMYLLRQYHYNNYTDIKFGKDFHYSYHYCEDKTWLYFGQKDNNYVVKIGNKYIGAFEFEEIKNTKRVHINYLYVYPEYRNKGIAKAILDYIFRTTGKLRVTLTVWGGNIKAKEAYKNIGFEMNKHNPIVLRKRFFYKRYKRNIEVKIKENGYD